jgi:hypothetical protein
VDTSTLLLLAAVVRTVANVALRVMADTLENADALVAAADADLVCAGVVDALTTAGLDVSLMLAILADDDVFAPKMNGAGAAAAAAGTAAGA